MLPWEISMALLAVKSSVFILEPASGLTVRPPPRKADDTKNLRTGIRRSKGVGQHMTGNHMLIT